MTERSARLVPPHVLVMLSTSTAAYALALAGVAGQQSAADASLAAERAPLARAVEQVSVGHDQMGARLDRARSRYAAAAQAYLAAGDSITTLEVQLGTLSKAVSAVAGVSRSLPATVRLPSVAGSVARGRAPATHATTGASGH
jgi:hypothetical protein